MKKLLIILLTVLETVQCINIYLPQGAMKCFYEHLNNHQQLSGMFSTKLTNDAHCKLQISIYETYDNNELAFRKTYSDSAGFTFTSLGVGEHKICVQHLESTLNQPLLTTINLSTKDTNLLKSKQDVSISSLFCRVDRLYSILNSIKLEQKNTRERATNYEKKSLGVRTKVTRWCLFQFTFFLGFYSFQSRRFKHFLAKNKYYL